MNPILFPARTEQARLEAMKRHPSNYRRNEKMSFKNIAEVKKANKANGGQWFDNDYYHGARRESDVIGGFYWVESAYSDAGNDESPRVFRAVGVSPAGDVQYLDGGDHFQTLEEARAVIDSIVESR